ncbi:MAG: DNA repair protein RadC [Elusimicrobiaceae bacterium]|nr:DNA repair protein RadC [Elusimicrobiaceae bacterium]
MNFHNKPAHIGHRQRIKKRFANSGLDSFLDHEVLELLLTYVIARKDTKPIAWALLKRFGSLAEVLDADKTALEQIDGVGENTALFIQLIRGTLKKYTQARLPKRIPITNPQQVMEYCKASLSGKQHECLEIIFLSVRNTLIGTQVIASGSLSEISVTPRMIVQSALDKKAAAIILVHNHPSGDVSPSKEDIELTQQTLHAAQLMGIILHDHLIISRGLCYSLKAAGYL